MQTAAQINLPQTGTAYSTVKPEPSLNKNPIFTGARCVWGVPLFVKTIANKPPGKMRLRFRNTAFAKAYFKTESGIRCFFLEDRGDCWWPVAEQGRNVRA